jgi:acetolactate synthase-1/2/3 large subunit
MKKSGAWLTVHALEQIGVTHTFGIPGVHNTEIYDELNRSERITPVLVTHEQGAAFMAEAVSRTGGGIGCLVIVPAAGMAYAMAGIGEAFLDGTPLLVISGGIRRDSGHHFQLHELNQQRILAGITKAAYLVDTHAAVVPTIYEAYALATSGEPGPVFVEIAGDVQLFTAEVGDPPPYRRVQAPSPPDPALVTEAAKLLLAAEHPGLYLGWGARDASCETIALADLLGAPVSTTLQGLSVFPYDHPLHTGMGFGPSAVPAARKVFADCDCLLAIGVRFAELATGSYGLPVPKALIHADINPNVFGRNYPAAVAIESDATLFALALRAALEQGGARPRDAGRLKATIAEEKRAFRESWRGEVNEDKVGPGVFFAELEQRLERDAYVVVDDGNHTFLAAEQLPIYEPKHFISPTDFNCMGYAVPAAIGTKLAHPDQQVVAIVGDGGFMMTALEILTAATNQLGCVFFVFHDGELGQIAQFQHIPLKYKTCTTIGDIRFEGVATATGAAYLRMENDGSVGPIIEEALVLAGNGAPVIVDVNIDYSRKSEFTQGVVKVNLGRFPLGQKLRFVGRALKRHTIG